jgi:type 1 glutamine amidotransferase
MKLLPKTLVLLAACGLAFSQSFAADAATLSKKKVLFFSKSSGFEHSVIKRVTGNPSFAENILKELGDKHAIDFTFSKDGSLFTAEYLAQFDAYIFYTTGDLTLARNDEKYGDDQPPMTAAGKEALLKAIENGKGFIGLHSATDTFHSPGNKDQVPARYVNDGDKADPFVKMLGAEFIRHDAQQKSRQIVADAKFPGMDAVAADFGPHEEWYSLKNFSPDIHVLLVQDTTGMKGSSYARPPFPATWAKMHGKGRVFYTSMGHREDIWTNPTFQSVLMGGINWTVRRVDADVTPNIAKVTPEANVLPAPPPPAPKAAQAAPSPAPAPATTK